MKIYLAWGDANLLISNGKNTLRVLVLLRESLQPLDGRRL